MADGVAYGAIAIGWLFVCFWATDFWLETRASYRFDLWIRNQRRDIEEKWRRKGYGKRGHARGQLFYGAVSVPMFLLLPITLVVGSLGLLLWTVMSEMVRFLFSLFARK